MPAKTGPKKKAPAVTGPPSAAQVAKDKGLLPAERGEVEPTDELPPTHPRRGRQKPKSVPAPIPMQARLSTTGYPHIEVPRRIEVKQLVTAMVKIEEGGMMYRLQFMAAEDLEPAKPCEVVPGTSQLLRMKRLPEPGQVPKPEV